MGASRGVYSSKDMNECKEGNMANASRDPYAAVNLPAACSGLGKTALALAYIFLGSGMHKGERSVGEKGGEDGRDFMYVYSL